MLTRDPCLLSSRLRPDEVPSLGHPLVDRYVEFVVSRARPNTVRATVSDLRAFLAIVDKDPVEVQTADVLAFIGLQRKPRPGLENVVRLGDRESGLSSRTVQRRLASISGLFGYLVMIDEIAANPVPRGLTTRRAGRRNPALVRSPRTLPKILTVEEVDALLAALRRWRTGRWSKRCCWAGCGAARCWGCGSRISAPARAACSSPKARAAISG